MFKPIIHNLTPDSPGYEEAQHYNKLIAAKPKGPFCTLAELVELQRIWKGACERALQDAQNAMVGVETWAKS